MIAAKAKAAQPTNKSTIHNSTATSYSRTRKRRKRPPNSQAEERFAAASSDVRSTTDDLINVETNNSDALSNPMLTESNTSGARLAHCNSSQAEQRQKDDTFPLSPTKAPLQQPKMRNKFHNRAQAPLHKTVVLISALVCAATIGSLISGKQFRKRERRLCVCVYGVLCALRQMD